MAIQPLKAHDRVSWFLEPINYRWYIIYILRYIFDDIFSVMKMANERYFNLGNFNRILLFQVIEETIEAKNESGAGATKVLEVRSS